MNSEEKAVRVVSPPREKGDGKPLKGILKQPRPKFPEEQNFIREGAAPHKDDKKAKDVPPGAKWTKISRKVVNPEALTIGKERFEVRDDFVIVLRVLDKEEIQAYAAATQVLRGEYFRLANHGGASETDMKQSADTDVRTRTKRLIEAKTLTAMTMTDAVVAVAMWTMIYMSQRNGIATGSVITTGPGATVKATTISIVAGLRTTTGGHRTVSEKGSGRSIAREFC